MLTRLAFADRADANACGPYMGPAPTSSIRSTVVSVLSVARHHDAVIELHHLPHRATSVREVRRVSGRDPERRDRSRFLRPRRPVEFPIRSLSPRYAASISAFVCSSIESVVVVISDVVVDGSVVGLPVVSVVLVAVDVDVPGDVGVEGLVDSVVVTAATEVVLSLESSSEHAARPARITVVAITTLARGRPIVDLTPFRRRRGQSSGLRRTLATQRRAFNQVY